MNSNAIRIYRTLAASVIAVSLLAAAGGAASARPDPGEPTHHDYSYQSPGECTIHRIDRQLVKCDDLTGAGVAAPLTVPEL